MGKLFCSDVNRIRKDKTFTVVIVILAVLAVAWISFNWLNFRKADAVELEAMNITAQKYFFQAFMLNDVAGMVATVVVALILFKDFGQGTIRNKIIAGNTRTSVYGGIFLSGLIAVLGIILTYAVVVLGAGLVAFPYRYGAFGWREFWYLLGSLGLEINLYLFVAALITFICTNAKSVGSVVLKYLGIIMTLPMVNLLLVNAISRLEMAGGKEKLLKVLHFIRHINVFNYSAVIGMGSAYEKKELVYMIVTPLVLTALLLVAGGIRFRKKELK